MRRPGGTTARAIGSGLVARRGRRSDAGSARTQRPPRYIPNRILLKNFLNCE
jgi:hypothetical protein